MLKKAELDNAVERFVPFPKPEDILRFNSVKFVGANSLDIREIYSRNAQIHHPLKKSAVGMNKVNTLFTKAEPVKLVPGVQPIYEQGFRGDRDRETGQVIENYSDKNPRQFQAKKNYNKYNHNIPEEEKRPDSPKKRRNNSPGKKGRNQQKPKGKGTSPQKRKSRSRSRSRSRKGQDHKNANSPQRNKKTNSQSQSFKPKELQGKKWRDMLTEKDQRGSVYGLKAVKFMDKGQLQALKKNKHSLQLSSENDEFLQRQISIAEQQQDRNRQKRLQASPSPSRRGNQSAQGKKKNVYQQSLADAIKEATENAKRRSGNN